MSALDDVEAALNDNATEEQKQRALAVLPRLAKLGQWGKQSFVPSHGNSLESTSSGVATDIERAQTRATPWMSLAIAASLILIVTFGLIRSWTLQERIATISKQVKSHAEQVANQGEELRSLKKNAVLQGEKNSPYSVAFNAEKLVKGPAPEPEQIIPMVEEALGHEDAEGWIKGQLLAVLGACYVLQGKEDDAETALVEAKSIMEKLVDGPLVGETLGDCNLNLARLYARTKQFEKGVAHCEGTLATYRKFRAFGPYIPGMHDALGATFVAMDQMELAANEFRKAAIAASQVDITPSLRAVYLYNYGVAQFNLAYYAEAETPLSTSLDGFELFDGAGKADTLKARALLGRTQLALGELRESERTLRPLLAFKAEGDSTTQVEIIAGRSALGAALVQQGSIDEGIPIARTALADIEAVVGKESGYYSEQELNLAALLLKTDEFAEGEEILLARLEKAAQENEHDLTASILYNLGLSSSWKGDYEEAKGYYARAREVPLPASSNVLRGRILSQYGTVLCKLFDFEEGIKLQKEGVQLLANSLPLTNPIFVNERNNLVVSLNREDEQGTYFGQLAIATSVIDGTPLTRT